MSDAGGRRTGPAPPRGPPLWALLAASVMLLSLLGALVGTSATASATSGTVALPHAGSSELSSQQGPSTLPSWTYTPSSALSAPLFNPPHLTTAVHDVPSKIYTYRNQQEMFPQDSQVSLWVNATGNGVPNYANVQVVFVVETTLYDGVYDPTVSDPGTNNPCNGPCEESDSVPFFVANAGRLATDIADNNPYSTVSFAMVDYFATLTDHDDGDGAEYHVDVGTFTPASGFQSAVVSGFQNPVLGGNLYYSDSDFSDNIGDSSSITALYGALSGSNLAWNPSDHHVIVWIGSTAPRDAGYSFNYAGTHSDYNSGLSATCEPSYTYGGGLTSPSCEGWISGTSNLASLAKSLGVTVDAIDVDNGMTDANSQDYTTASYGSSDSASILKAGCDLATATGGSWEGPPGYSCSVASTGTGLGNLTCVQGGSCFEGQNGGTYQSPPRAWTQNTPLGWAIDHISFGPTSVTNVTATTNGAPMFQFVPALNITPDPSTPGWTVSCLRGTTSLPNCQQTPSTTSSGSATMYGWGWPQSTMDLNESWRATFNVVAVGGPFNQSYPLDACSTTIATCWGPPNGSTALSMVDYKNYQGTPTSLSFPPSDLYVVYPGMSVVVSPAFSRGPSGFSQVFSVSASGGSPPYTYQWSVCQGSTCTVQPSTATTMTYTFTSAGSYAVRCLVHDQFNKVGVSAVGMVTILASTSNLFALQGVISDAKTLAPIPGATVALNGTWGSTLTSSSGGYTLGPISNGTYTLYVNATGYASYVGAVVVSGSSWANVSLTAVPPRSYLLQGYVSAYANGVPLSGAAVTLSYYGTTMGSATSNAQGYYAISGVLNATYTLSASLAGYNPASLSVTVQGSNVFQNISLTNLPPTAYYITGTVRNATSGAALKGVTVSLNGSLMTNLTNSNGVYLLTPVYAGVYTVATSMAGYASLSKTANVGPSNVTNFWLSPPPVPPTPTYAISGTILDASTHLPVNGATVIVSTSAGKVVDTVHASASGDYAATGLLNGSYDYSVSDTGYYPFSNGLVINGASQALNILLTPIPGGSIQYFSVQGLVVDAFNASNFLSGVNVSIAPLVGYAITGTAGTFLFPQVASGSSYTLTATKVGYSNATENFSVNGANVQLTVNMTPLGGVQTFAINGLVYDSSTSTGIVGATVRVVNATTPPVAPESSGTGGGFTLHAANGHYEVEATATGFSAGFANLTVKGSALSGVMLFLTPEVPTGHTSSSGPTNSNGWLSPGWGGLYLQVWVPIVIGIAAVAGALSVIRSRHAAHAKMQGKSARNKPSRSSKGSSGKTEEGSSPSGGADQAPPQG